MSSRAIIGYWNCRGFINAIKLILEYQQIPYEVRHPECGPAPHYDIKDWLAKKHQVLSGYHFPNLPFYQDETVKMTHYFAIMQYLGRKYKLVPSEEPALSDSDMVREEIRDMYWKTIDYLYFSDHRAKGTEPSEDEKRSSRLVFQSSVRPHLQSLSNFLSQRPEAKFLFGNDLTYVDFLLYEHLDHVRLLEKEIVSSFGSLAKFMADFEAVPNIKAYLESDRFQRYPLFGERSYIGRKENDIPSIN